MPPARTILLDRELPEAALLAEALAERAGRKVALSVPQRGDRRRLLDQAKRNAEEALDRRLAESTTQAKLLREVAELFELRRAARPDRGLRQQPYPGHQRGRRDGRRGAGGVPQGPVPQVQHQARPRPTTISR